jgi:hypothetical protein
VVTAELSPLDWSDHTLDVLTALGTAGAVVVAVSVALLGWIIRAVRERRRAPQLAVTYDWQTSDDDVERSAEAILRAAAETR